MNKNKKVIKAMSSVLCASMLMGGVQPIYASTNETQSTSSNDKKEVEVLYNKSASYFVTIPKNITLDSNKESTYNVKVEGDIPSDKNVYVTPIDAISETIDTIDFYMHDQSVKNPKDDVVATVTQNKETWDFEEVQNSVEESNNTINASNLTAGNWKGTFNFNINLKDAHKHTYTSVVTKEATCAEKGVKTFTCVDGDDSYTEEIPMIEHNYGEATYTWSSDKSTCTAKRVCANDASHVETETVNTTSTIIKDATCTEAGTKTCTATFKNSAFAKQTTTNTIPATGHNYVKGICTNCGDENFGEDVTLTSDNLSTYGITTSGKVTIPNVVMSSDGVWHKVVEIKESTFKNCTSLISIILPDNGIIIHNNTFNGCTNLSKIIIPKSVIFSVIHQSPTTNPFYGCNSLKTFGPIGSGCNVEWGPSNICYAAFAGNTALTSITLPNEITTIETYAFCDCTSLTSVKYKGKTYTNKQELINALTSNGVTLENYVFRNAKLS